MKIAIHNCYSGQEVAESEFSRRIDLAASNLGWQTAETASSSEIKDYRPDFVLALHFRTPKLTQYPTYGSMVTPPVFFAKEDEFVKNVLSYDGYLSSSESISSWLRSLLYCTSKGYFIADWYTSCQQVPYRVPQLTNPRVVYVGTNWDGARFKHLLQRLDSQPYMDIYGPKAAWSHIQNSYRGALPFDGSSILNTLNSAGVGLCLHREEHCAAGTPSTRIFEIAASGAVAICQEHPFIRQAFGDSVLYVETGADVAKTTSQISEHFNWIKENREEALELSRRAYSIFIDKYTLERFLRNIGNLHQSAVVEKGFVSRVRPNVGAANAVQFVVRVGDRDTKAIEPALASLASQTHQPVGAIVVRYGNVAGLSDLLDAYSSKLSIQLVDSPPTGFRSSQLWDGLRSVSSKHFAVLDDDDLIYPNHVHSLLQVLDGNSDCGVAYSGAVRRRDASVGPPAERSVQRGAELSDLAYFEPFDLNRLVSLDNFITSNSFVARSSLLEGLGGDPRLNVLEDLFLLLRLAQTTKFMFSFEVTSEFSWRGDRGPDAVWLDRNTWLSAAEQIRTILWRQGFSVTQNPNDGPNQRIAKLEKKLADTTLRIDDLTRRLNRYLDVPLVGVARRIRRLLLRLPSPSDK